jgi:hypothetical protein
MQTTSTNLNGNFFTRRQRPLRWAECKERRVLRTGRRLQGKGAANGAHVAQYCLFYDEKTKPNKTNPNLNAPGSA